ncbi:MAG TPA: hypothetical protein VFM21_07875 [Terriglobia bacterium]|nr:hypothetical protein [Terriglobia bacterium]
MAAGKPLEPALELFEEFEHCCRATEYLVGALPARLWSLEPPGGKGRSNAAMVAHLQSVRRMFAKMGGANPLSPSLGRARCTPAEAKRALALSREALTKLFRAALTEGRPRAKGFGKLRGITVVYKNKKDLEFAKELIGLKLALK